MGELARVTINWTGFTGGPGYTNWYWRNATPGVISQAVADNAVLKTNTFLATLTTRLPPVVTVQVDPSVEVIEDTNGNLQRFMNVTAPAARVGEGTGNYAAATGAVINWYTNTVRNSRRMRGRSFMVPFAGNALASNGTLDDTLLTGLRGAVTSMLAATGDARLVVWGRPSTPGGSDGISAEVASFNIPDKTAVLTSRRD